MEITENLVGSILSVVLLSGLAYILINSIVQKRAQKEIEEHLGSYQVLAKKHSIWFKIFAYEREPIPGIDFFVEFTGPTVQARLTPAQALKFLTTVKNGDPDIKYLEEKSEWSSSPIL